MARFMAPAKAPAPKAKQPMTHLIRPWSLLSASNPNSTQIIYNSAFTYRMIPPSCCANNIRRKYDIAYVLAIKKPSEEGYFVG